MGLKGIGLLVIAIGVAAPQLASAHARLMSPKPRNNSDALKTGPCGGVARTAAPTTYSVGSTVTVNWEETIGHQGCFQIALSEANDQNFTLLKQINDPAGGGPSTKYTDTVKLPDGVTCNDCTLVLRQLMQGAPCPNNANPAQAAQGTYYSCADIKIVEGDAGPIEPPVDEDGGTTSSSSSGGTTTVPTDGGGKTTDPDDDDEASPSRNLRAGQGEGCNVGSGAAGGVSFFVTAGIAVMALRRRRRR